MALTSQTHVLSVFIYKKRTHQTIPEGQFQGSASWCRVNPVPPPLCAHPQGIPEYPELCPPWQRRSFHREHKQRWGQKFQHSSGHKLLGKQQGLASSG